MLYLSRCEQIALALLIALLLGGAGLFTYARGQHASQGDSNTPIFVPAPQHQAAAVEVTVHVLGAVLQPGVYRLPPGSRIANAIERAGGATPDADLAILNQAAPLQDGIQIMVPKQGAQHAPATRSSPGAPPGPISLNAATAAQLESLPGIGPTYAQHIIAYRDQKMRQQGCGFQSVDELLNIHGIGPKRLAALRDYVVP
jgi:competence protein ComEA